MTSKKATVFFLFVLAAGFALPAGGVQLELPQFDSEADECADGCQDGPIWEDEWDQLQCEYGIDGWTEPAGFDRAFVQDWIDDSGIDASTLCSCAAAIMKDQSEDYLAEQAQSDDPELYWSYMRGAIDQCQMAMWQRPLP